MRIPQVAADLILGADHSDQDLVTELEKLFRVLFAGLFPLAPWLPGGAYSKAVAARRQILQRLKAVLSKRRSGESSGRADVLGTLLSSPSLADDSKPMTDEEICDVVINLLFAGHDTSSCALTWVFWYLSQHPAVLEAVRAEQVAVAESAGEGLTWEDIERMTYTEQVLKEVIRITPPIGGVSRKTAQDTEYSGMRFPGGCPVFCSIGYVHSSPELFPEPHKFDPSRFAGGDPPEFTPFGGGGADVPWHALLDDGDEVHRPPPVHPVRVVGRPRRCAWENFLSDPAAEGWTASAAEQKDSYRGTGLRLRGPQLSLRARAGSPPPSSSIPRDSSCQLASPSSRPPALLLPPRKPGGRPGHGT
eukprot:CAMPEP_0177589636 /NCGR_PEP_ID=MMETSP0419_2-20121207/6928_1 /TAXON_ID=582737 /ORGANISM="Tetraselmis sp., Strain GSL018" /LENGTH=360 /DNA_ID=CAMNT_0019080041 /DNA_START=766 /DNA_END=1847 /DNA_ORIENTATION=-